MNAVWSPTKVTDVERLREAIRTYRKKHGLSLKEMGKLLETSDVTVSRWLRGGGIAVRNFPLIEKVCGAYITEGPKDAAKPSPAPRVAGPVIGGTSTIPNTEELAEYIMLAMVKQELNVSSLCRQMGYDNPNTIHRLFARELKGWFPTVLASACSALDIDPSDLPIATAQQEAIADLQLGLRHGSHVRDIPVIGSAQAAELTFQNGQLLIPDWDDAEKIHNPADGRRCVAFRVEGLSMSPRLYDGDIVVVDTELEPRNRDIAVIITREDEILIKEWNQFGETVELRSINRDAGQDRTLKISEIKWARKAIRRSGAL